MNTIGVDFETFYHKKLKYGIEWQGVWKYCDDARFDPYLISVYDGSEAWAGHPRDFNWNSLDGAHLLSHNAQFERTVHAAMVRKNLAPSLNIPRWTCTANMTSYLCNRRALDKATEFLLGVKISKEVRDYADGKHWADIVSDGRADDMLAYGRSDVVYCHGLWTRYGHLWPEWEQRVSELTIRQGMRGIQINVELLKEYIVVATQMLQATERLLPWIEEGRAPTSPKAIAEACRAADIPCPPVQSHFEDGAERMMQWEAAYGPRFPWVVNVSSWRQINKFLDSLQTISERLQDDGIFAFGLKYFGAHTGRWSGAEGFNMQNLRKTPLYRDEAGLLIVDPARLKEIEREKVLPSYVTFALDIRKLFIPRAGRKMIVCDSSQIEPRCLSWSVQDQAKLDMLRAGKSPYQAHAELTMGWDGGDLKKLIASGRKDLADFYALSKARELGLGFGCGWKKFIFMAMDLAQYDVTKDDPEVTPKLSKTGEPCLDKEGNIIMESGYGFNSKRIVKEWRAANPLIAARDFDHPENNGLWARLDEAFKASSGRDFEIELPSGRCLRYGQVRRECRTEQDEDTGAFVRRWVTTANIGGRRFVIYGGKLTENMIQAFARDVFAQQLLELDNTPGIATLFSSHDEAILEADNHITEADVQTIMSKAPDWAPGLPVAAEAKEVPHYVK